MALRNLNTEWKHVKSYATEARLMAEIAKMANDYPDCNDRFMVVRTPEGRWTAVVVLDKSVGGYIGRYPFMKV